MADAADAWSVGRWARAVAPLLQELKAQGRAALIVGGTGLYFTALTKGIADIPDVPVAAREATQEAYDFLGEDAFRARLAERDPRAAASIARRTSHGPGRRRPSHSAAAPRALTTSYDPLRVIEPWSSSVR